MDLFLNSDLYRTLCKLYSHDRVMQTMETLRNLERPRRYSAFRDSTAWCVQVLENAGFADVRRIAHKADGETASYDFIMPQAWDLLRRSTLQIVEPCSEIIADTDWSTIHVTEYSAPTPEGGVTAELVDAARLDMENPDCKGKFVFQRGYIPVQDTFYYKLASAGCAGIVYAAFETTTHEPDVPTWTNGHGRIGWYHLKEDPVVPVFCVTPKKGIELAQLLSKGKVILHGEMNTKIYDGEIYTVTATIPGKSEEEFALLGHLYEPFYADDCQGFAVGVEVALLLKQLIDKGVLPQPEKTFRLVFSMERYGFAAFFANHRRKILAAMSIDTVTCLGSKILNTGTAFTESPLSLPFFGDMLVQEAMRTFCPDVKWRMVRGNLSDDCWASEPSMDIPTNWIHGSSKSNLGDYHHCDAPIFDAVEQDVLDKLIPIIAVYSAVMICGSKDHFVQMSVELEKVAAEWLETEKNYAAGLAASCKLSKTDALWHNKAMEMLYLGRMESFNRFYPGIVVPKLPEHWADRFYDTLSDRELSAAEKEAAQIRYQITVPGMPFSQARVPADARVTWKNIPELTWALLSPERSVLDAIRLRDAVHSVHSSDDDIRYYLSYFRFLEKYGYLRKIQ